MRYLSIYGEISFAENSFLSSFLMNILLVCVHIVFIYAYIKSKTENYIVIYMGKRSDKICLLLAKHFVYMYIQSAKRAIYALNMIFINISDLLLKQ